MMLPSTTTTTTPPVVSPLMGLKVSTPHDHSRDRCSLEPRLTHWSMLVIPQPLYRSMRVNLSIIRSWRWCCVGTSCPRYRTTSASRSSARSRRPSRSPTYKYARSSPRSLSIAPRLITIDRSRDRDRGAYVSFGSRQASLPYR